MAIDDRIAVAAPSCYVTSLERLFATIGPQDAEQNVTGQVALGIDHADYVAMRAPRPTILCVGTQDYFDIDGAWSAFREAKKLYGILGHGERVDLFESDETHGFTLPRRQAVMRWMRRWLLAKDDAPNEVLSPVATDEELKVTKSGQVLLEYKGVSAFDLTAQRARELARERTARSSGRTRDSLRDEVRSRLAMPNSGEIIVSGQDRQFRRDGRSVDRWAVTTEPGVTIPVLLFRPDKPAPNALTIVYVGADRALAGPGGPVEAHLNEGRSVALIEPRGTGESRPTPPGRGGYGHGPFGSDEREAFLSILLNRPLIGQRVFDLLQALRAIGPAEGPRRFRLIGIGAGGPVALHVATLSDEVAELELDGSILSWTDVATTPASAGQLSGVVPGVLTSYDLPDLLAALAPRPVTVSNPASPGGGKASPEDVARGYATVTKAYVDAPQAFRIVP